MTETPETDQAHLDRDVAGYTVVETDFVETVIELKTQVATNPAAPASSLDFTRADALLSKMNADDPINDPASTAGPVVDPGTDQGDDTPVASQTTADTGIDPDVPPVDESAPATG